MRRPHAAPVAVAAVLTAVGLVAGACGSSDPTTAPLTSTESAQTSNSAAPTTPPSTTGTTPTTAPATGIPLKVDYVGQVKVAARAPQGYVTSPSIGPVEAAARTTDGTVLVTMTVSATIVSPGSPGLLKQARIANRDTFGGNGKVLSPITVDGRAYFAVSGSAGGFQVLEYGTDALIGTNGVGIVLDFHFKPSVPMAQRHAVVDSVLPTLRVGPA